MAGKEMYPNYLGTGSGYNANSFTPAYFNRPENMASTFASDSFNLKLPSINQNLTTEVHVHVDGAELTHIFNGVAHSRIENRKDSMTFNLNQMTFKN